MPHSIVITDQDIHAVAVAMGCQFADTARREALKCTESRDVQACPGSGKTTLVVAKLMVLARHWRWQDKGICVLSHTNVAREEVERRLAQHPVGHRVLGYPHFIGTIQRFVDKYLALPYVRSQGIEVVTVDDERFKKRALQLLARYPNASRYLSHRRNGDELAGTLRLEGAALTLGCAADGGLPLGEGTRAYRELCVLKRRLCSEGIFRFDDMYAFADAYLHNCPGLVEAIRLRFPWVFIDEMQDTDLRQDGLLGKVFGEGCVLQRFGDVNQAIYGEDALAQAQSTFPHDNSIELADSMRFGEAIAGFASCLTVVTPQVVCGTEGLPSRCHTVFLFDEQSIEQVLPAFVRLLGQEYAGGVPQDFVAKAVGFRKSVQQRDGTARLPYSLGDYWPRFQPEYTVRFPRPSDLLACVRKARHLIRENGECRDSYGLVLEGLLRLLNLARATDGSGAAFTKTRLLDAVKGIGAEDLAAFRELLVNLVLPSGSITHSEWLTRAEFLKHFFAPWTGPDLSPEAHAFLQWTDPHDVLEDAADEFDPTLVNVYGHDLGGEHLPVEVTTIHAVKGQTHTATLVLETFWHEHDVKEMVPFLVGEMHPSAVERSRARERMKRIYVAMTRPKELLCLAVHRDHVSRDQRNALERRGWSVQDLAA